ncbi:small GTP-binding protein [Histomonas meleagridis]|uniref:small GTP-binding protein n=1 Tax=Histomonas meleagridis TaxID=135588 RepID=UPI00355ABAE7|nr:small GTP-binding protein [Histomonas meleagridis]KAH0796452.1 small GTP-binding protein [Histomonas meleagridis]
MSGKKFSLKVILVGNSGVGKTSLVSAFFENPFETQSLPTIAPASCSAIIPLDNNVSVELQIWDTAGQERFQSISHMFYRDSHIAFVCFDKESVDSVEIWIGRVRAEVPECAIFLVTTKSDLLVDTERTELEEKGAEMIKRFGAKLHAFTSSSKGTGIKELFRSAAQFVNQIYVSNQPTTEIDLTTKQETKKCNC